MKPLVYLELRQLINSIRNTARSPKRLVPALILAAWVVAWFVQSITDLAGGASAEDLTAIQPGAAIPMETIKLIAFLAMSIGSVAVMYGAFSSGLMVFSIAHIDFLFPTPISRRKVLLVKLLRDYAKYGFWVAFFFFFIGSPLLSRLNMNVLPWGLVSVAAVVALLLLVVNLAHTINIVFTFGYERLRQAGALIKVLLVGVPASAVLYGIHQYVTTGDSYASLLFAVNSPILGVVFAPARWATELFFAPMQSVTPEEWGYFGLLWLLAGASLALLLSRRENLYEPSLGISVRYARRRQLAATKSYADVRTEALREKGTRQAGGSAIPAFGGGATAFLWKNLVLRYRIYRGQLAFMVVVPLAIVYIIKRFVPDVDVMRNIPFAMIYIVWVLSMAAQGEMRADLRYANTMKSMPIAAWKLVLAQVGSSVIFLSLGTMVFAAYLWAIVPATRGPILACCTLTAPFVGFANIAAALIPAILYPDTRDVAQNYLCGLIGFLLASLALLPTVVLGILSYVVLKLTLVLTFAIVAAANLMVGSAGVAIAGAAFRKFDPTGE